MRFGFCAPKELAATVAAAGYDYIELALAPTLQPETDEGAILPNLTALLGETKIGADALNVFLPGDLKVVGPAVDEARQERYLQAAFRRVAAIGGKVVVFGSGGSRRIPEGFSREEAWRQTVAFLRLAGPLAAAQNVTVAIEPLNTGECNFINSVAEGLALAQEVNHPAIRVLSDLYHVCKEGQSFDETRDAGAWLHHVHVAGREWRRVPTDDDLEYLASYFAVLKAMGYAGRISVEGNAADIAQEAPVALDVMRRAWDLA